jgi:hypothetical protein
VFYHNLEAHRAKILSLSPLQIPEDADNFRTHDQPFRLHLLHFQEHYKKKKIKKKEKEKKEQLKEIVE